MSRHEPKARLFVPREALDPAREACSRPGRGGSAIRAPLLVRDGHRHFLGRGGTDPAVGQAGTRPARGRCVETVVAGERPTALVRRPRRAHPYEESPTTSTSSRSPVKTRLFTDGGARGNPAPPPTASCWRRRTARPRGGGRGDRGRDQQRGRVPGAPRRPREGARAARPRGGGRLRLRALVKQMTGSLPGQERGAPRASIEAARLSRRLGRVPSPPSAVSTTCSPTGS